MQPLQEAPQPAPGSRAADPAPHTSSLAVQFGVRERSLA